MMTSGERFIGGFALLAYKGWQLAITGYWRLPGMFFPERDIFGEAHYWPQDRYAPGADASETLVHFAPRPSIARVQLLRLRNYRTFRTRHLPHANLS